MGGKHTDGGGEFPSLQLILILAGKAAQSWFKYLVSIYLYLFGLVYPHGLDKKRFDSHVVDVARQTPTFIIQL